MEIYVRTGNNATFLFDDCFDHYKDCTQDEVRTALNAIYRRELRMFKGLSNMESYYNSKITALNSGNEIFFVER